MTLARAFVHDPADVREETHVQHAVGFVEHEKLNLVKPARAATHVIQQAAGRGDDDIHALTQGVHLLAITDAAVKDRRAEIGETRKIAKRGFDLGGQFTGGFQDEHARLPLVRAELGKDGQGERGGLAGAGLCAADDVRSRHDQRDGAQLDRRRFGVTHGLDPVHHGIR